MRLVEHSVARLVVGQQPLGAMFTTKALGPFGQEARRHHVSVEGVLGLFLGQPARFGLFGEFVFDSLPDVVACKCQVSVDANNGTSFSCLPSSM